MEEKEFWNRFDILLSKTGKTMIKFFDELKISYSTMTQQRKRKQYPKLADAIRIAEGLHISLDELMGYKTNTQPILSPRLLAMVSKILTLNEIELSQLEIILSAFDIKG